LVEPRFPIYGAQTPWKALLSPVAPSPKSLFPNLGPVGGVTLRGPTSPKTGGNPQHGQKIEKGGRNLFSRREDWKKVGHIGSPIRFQDT